jgi:dienelactone hydrolase
MSYPHYTVECGEHHDLVRDFGGDGKRPVIVCLCGSTRFRDEFTAANRRQTLDGRIVLAPGVFGWSGDLSAEDSQGGEVKTNLDDLHKRKIDLADEVLVVSRDGYFGQSTAGEIAYAVEHGKPVRFAEPAAAQRARELGLMETAQTLEGAAR